MIARKVSAAAHDRYDVIIVGGGIQGACLLLEAARNGRKALLLERDDFGGATSWNSLRIVHGGLRYLQSANLRRFFHSVAERRWFMQAFPDLVKPLPCLMPLYGQGLKRPAVLRAALAINEALGASRGIDHPQWGRGRVLNDLDTLALAPFTAMHQLRGAALWYDAAMTSSQRVVMEIIKWACSLGGQAMNYVKVDQLVQRGGEIVAVKATDQLTHVTYEIETSAVANCSGPWSDALQSTCRAGQSRAFLPSLAFNLLLDRDPISSCAVAVSPRRKDAQPSPVYFMYPFHGKVLAGTMHVPWEHGPDQPRPTHQQVGRMIHDLNAAAPGLDVDHDDVLRVFSGLLPARRRGTNILATREVVHDHRTSGGPAGLVSVVGVKFTTARRVACQAMRTLFPQRVTKAPPSARDRPRSRYPLDLHDPKMLFTEDDEVLSQGIVRLVHDEAVMYLDDLLLRRTDWLMDPRDVQRVTERVLSLVPHLALHGRPHEKLAVQPVSTLTGQ